MAEPAMFTPEDFWRIRFITEMQLAPNGQTIAYTLEWNDQQANEKRSAIWLHDLTTNESHQLTNGLKLDNTPRWSPDGTHLAFLSTRDGAEAQLYLLPLVGGEARRVTMMRRGIGAPFWSVDGHWIGFESEVRPGDTPTTPDTRDAATRERDEKDEAERPHIYTRQQYRWDGKGYFEGRIHLFRAWLHDDHVEALTEGDYDHANGACSPDGRWLAFTSDRSDDRDANMATDLYLLDLQSKALKCLTNGQHELGQLIWSPDSAYIATIGNPIVREQAAYNDALLIATVADGSVVNLLQGQDVSASSGLYGDIPGPESGVPVWSKDGTTLLFVTQRRGGTALLSVPLATNSASATPETLIEATQRHIQSFVLLPSTTDDNQRIVALSASPTDLWDLWEYALPAEPHRLTNLNAALLAERQLVIPERFTCSSFYEQEIEGWLYRPTAPVSANTPLVLIIHGGPHGAYGETFMLRAQILAGKGYAVLYANPRGSTGYGEEFMQACDHDWGGGDYHDVMAMVDAALARGGLDGARLAVTGASYGGYMTNWIIGQTNRFAAAVTVHSVTNLHSSFGTGDIDSFSAEGDYGWPWEQASFYHERSPLTYADRVRTPIRIIAAERDYRCPISQSEEYFTWLKKRNSVPVDFVRLPNASHQAYASPRQRIRYLNLVFEWIERWIPLQ